MGAECTPPGSIYFGAPGGLITIEWPRGGIVRTRPQMLAPFELDGGGIRIAHMAGAGKIKYMLTWEALAWTEFTKIWAYEQGHNGIGPWVILDPRAVNLLTVNQSGTTSELNATTGFTVAGTGGALSSNTTFERGPRALRWTFGTATPGTSTVTLNTPSSDWTGVPVRTSTAYSFSMRFITAAGTSVTCTAEILWYTAAGAAISTSSGAATASGGAWATLSVSDTSPGTAAFALCRVEATSATIGVGDAVNFDKMQFEQAAAPTTWVPGVGLLPVDILGFAPEHHLYATGTNRVNNPVLTLQEVGP